MIAGVFLNRLDAHMPLQSDIAVMYALKKHKHRLSLKDIKVDSPYNLYVHKGFGPGPFNNPSLDSISAVLNPLERNRHYLYFVADLKTGKVYFNRKYIQHLNKNNSLGQ
ncbi:putative aminodeoxychorismate lyase [Lactobacillus iners UPII 143-D]|nr:putative aminodeoxychorismate lyase [Lactobacillus iners LactinV 03V1-b]EGC79250.1 putative aminodeoxychorismate lyase [Lactobacillus iners UPII 143-D]